MTVLKKTCGFLVALISLNGHAQSSDAGGVSEPSKGITSSQPDMAPPNAKVTKKAEKQANQSLQNDVRRALSRSKGLNIADVTVHVRGGDVTLQGYMQSQTQADQAAEVAKGVKGVISVINQIAIRPTMGS
ncbi:BON domain-containing protein [uncultured Caballeronia sp.]|uniref:BON domain-containing protein n=1 Tax=uncultured Caballeronia sp. TaxID=1827198 RepID=UPI0035CC89EE